MPYRFAMDIGLEMHRAKNTTDKNIKSRRTCARLAGRVSSDKDHRILKSYRPSHIENAA